MKELIFTLFILFPLFLSAKTQCLINKKSLYIKDARNSQSIRLFSNNEFFQVENEIWESDDKNSILIFTPSLLQKSNFTQGQKNELQSKSTNEPFTIHRKYETDISLENNLPATAVSAYNFQKVERRTLMAIGLIVVGIPVTAIGLTSNEMAIFTVGATAIFAGCTIALTGGYRVIEPGFAIKREAVTISAVENGFGLALNF
ncbi:hypothetical protein [Maribellus mangrovi]|uniref:hypothetical protein n=1 Tax=Maribellus mangrovi TaxID=3133146 RepID=UPI0030ECB91D